MNCAVMKLPDLSWVFAFFLEIFFVAPVSVLVIVRYFVLALVLNVSGPFTLAQPEPL